uniref:Uncharacterized protein n=1 Tax=Octopus bimaculoides TaxID=37653 RepID=A0A0L8I615_OCTBM
MLAACLQLSNSTPMLMCPNVAEELSTLTKPMDNPWHDTWGGSLTRKRRRPFGTIGSKGTYHR